MSGPTWQWRWWWCVACQCLCSPAGHGSARGAGLDSERSSILHVVALVFELSPFRMLSAFLFQARWRSENVQVEVSGSARASLPSSLGSEVLADGSHRTRRRVLACAHACAHVSMPGRKGRMKKRPENGRHPWCCFSMSEATSEAQKKARPGGGERLIID